MSLQEVDYICVLYNTPCIHTKTEHIASSVMKILAPRLLCSILFPTGPLVLFRFVMRIKYTTVRARECVFSFLVFSARPTWLLCWLIPKQNTHTRSRFPLLMIITHSLSLTSHHITSDREKKICFILLFESGRGAPLSFSALFHSPRCLLLFGQV